MRKLTLIQHISLDGIIQAPGGPNEDTDNNFTHGGWIAPHSDPLIRQTILSTHGPALDLLLGRRTYNIWSTYWPTISNTNPIAGTFNAATKYVLTHHPHTLTWGPAVPVDPDLPTSIQHIKSLPGPHLISWGSSTLSPLLLHHDLVDELLLFIYPVLLGTGKRLFSPTPPTSAPIDPRQLTLLSSTPTPSGVLINTYRPSGPLRTGSFTAPPPPPR